MTDNKYPELPTIEHWLSETYTASQMHQYVDTDRAMRAAEAETVASQWDNLRPDLIAALREVFDTSGPETPQAVRDVVEYTDSWLSAYIQKRLSISVQPQEAAPSQDAEDAALYVKALTMALNNILSNRVVNEFNRALKLLMSDAARAQQEGK